MGTPEPIPTAILMLVAGILIAVSVASSRASGRLGLPAALLFLGIGMLAGEDGLGIRFDDTGFAFRTGVAALSLILFDGGLQTSLRSVRAGLLPGGLLATVGVAGTAGILGAFAALAFGFDWIQGLLLGAVVSSTDAATVFAVLRSSGVQLQRRVGATLELESGLNDPVAVILTVSLTGALLTGHAPGLELITEIVVQLSVGAVLGLALGFAGSFALARLRLPAAGLYPVFTFALALLAFALPTLLAGSGFLAVYTAGVVIGNRPLPDRAGLLRFHDAAAWFSQVAMFLVLGLLVTPSRLFPIAASGLALALVLGLVARPVMVALCLVPLRFPPREILYVAWVGLRGAVPIVLASYPVLARAPGAQRIFDIVFFVVVVNALVHGSPVARLTRFLGLESKEPPAPQAVLEVHSNQVLGEVVISFYVDKASAVAGSRIADLPIPEGAAVMLVVRGSEPVAAKGPTELLPGDHVYMFCRPDDRPFLYLLFGREETS